MIYVNEIDPYCAAWLQNLMDADVLPRGHIDTRSIEDVTPNDLAGYTQCHFFAGLGGWIYALDLAGWPRDRPVWTGSCPCQPFSAAGKGAGFADERHLWPAWQHLIAQRKPATVFGEQVASKAADDWIDLVHADLEGMGYAFGCVPFPAASVGAPHIRDRTYWCGVGLADSDHARLEGRQLHAERATELAARACGVADGLADADRIRPSGDKGAQPGVLKGANGAIRDGSSALRPGPLHSFWRAADWLQCTDGKWRPVIATHVALADGLSDTLVPVRAERETEEKVRNHGAASDSNPDQELQALPGSTGSEDNQWAHGGSRRVHAPSLLRASLHGIGDGQAGVRQPEPLAHEGASSSDESVPDVREDGQAARSSPGREPFQQLPVELDDVVSLLPSSLSLAAHDGRRRDAEALRALCSTICAAGAMQYAPEQAQAIWASLSQEAKDRIGLGFDVRAWRKLVFQPLSIGEKSRVGKLRAYGNAIVPQQAAAFVASYLEAEGFTAIEAAA